MNVMPQAASPEPESQQNPEAVLSLRGLRAAYGDRVVLDGVDLDLPERGFVVLLGAKGSGRTTLLRVVCGLAQANPNMRIEGDCRYGGASLGSGEWPELVRHDARTFAATVRENLVEALPNRADLTPAEQHDVIAQHLADLGCSEFIAKYDVPALELEAVEQRILAILRQTLGGTALLCIDEPTARLDEGDAMRVHRVLRRWALHSTVLAVSNSPERTRQVADRVAFLQDGRVIEVSDVQAFFMRPRTDPVKVYLSEHGVQTETVAVAAPSSTPTTTAAAAMPRSMVWLDPGRLGGMGDPGCSNSLAADLDGLAAVQVSRLLSLGEDPLDCSAELARRGIIAQWIPVDDGAAPSLSQARQACAWIDAWLREGRAVVVHSRTGLGRAGTMLACYLIWRGDSAIEAIVRVRSLFPGAIRSSLQTEFVSEFSRRLRADKHARLALA